jgi:stalled ribosome alternative rescue factor ArfA
MKVKTTIKQGDIKVRKILPTHLVAQRVIKSKKIYQRKGKHGERGNSLSYEIYD